MFGHRNGKLKTTTHAVHARRYARKKSRKKLQVEKLKGEKLKREKLKEKN